MAGQAWALVCPVDEGLSPVSGTYQLRAVTAVLRALFSSSENENCEGYVGQFTQSIYHRPWYMLSTHIIYSFICF